MQSGNLFSDAIAPQVGERFDTILTHKNLVIERIISSAVIAPQEYVQTQDEWVLLIQGEAELRVSGILMSLHKGDYIFLPAGVPHIVERTVDNTIWLAIHLHN